jgi:hypothetical protein
MAIGWLGLLKAVPWGDVVSNAPKIADGAKSLWNTVAKKVRPGDPAQAGTATDPEQTIEQRVTTLEAGQAELGRQLIASTELIRSLADQNGQLIARLDALRSRLLWLGAIAAVALLAGGLALVSVLGR